VADEKCHIQTTTISFSDSGLRPPVRLHGDGPELAREWASGPELRVKIRSRQAARIAAGIPADSQVFSHKEVDGDPRYCAELNEYAVKLALQRLSNPDSFLLRQLVNDIWWSRYRIRRDGSSDPTSTRNSVASLIDLDLEGSLAQYIYQRFDRFGVPLQFENDLNMWNGGRWTLEPVKYRPLKYRGEIQSVSFRSHSIKFGINFVIQATAGVHFCKLVGVGMAMEWLYYGSLASSTY
jgi:hypothetical protein